jgi:hypothetical protein
MTLARNRLLVKIAHIVMFLKGPAERCTGNSKSRRTPANGEPLGTDFAANQKSRVKRAHRGSFNLDLKGNTY